MPRSKNRAILRVESLESIALLTVAAGVPLTGGPTGLGSVGSVSTTDAQALQQDASGGFLEQFISELEATQGRNAKVRQFASAVIADHQQANFDLQNTAGALGFSLGTGISSTTDVQDARTVLQAVKGHNLDKTYLKVMEQINAQDVAADQSLIGSTTVPAVSAYAQEALAIDQNHLQGAQQLLKNGKSTYSPTVAVPLIPPTAPPNIGGTPSASDIQALQQDGTGGELEILLSQIEVLHGTRTDAQQYAQTVINDHQVTTFGLQSTAAAGGFAIPTGITDPSDLRDLTNVLNAAKKGNVDKTYLQVMQTLNAQDIQSEQQLAASTQVPGIRTYALQTYDFDVTHLQGANMLLKQKGTTYAPGA